MSLPSALSGVTYSTRTPSRSLSGSRASRSRNTRKAASVFPDPVGATTNAESPRASAGQAISCAGVGSANVSRNQVPASVPRTASLMIRIVRRPTDRARAGP
jgi:hypothetical protein